MDDRVDSIIREWHDRRPKLDVSPLEVVPRVIRAAHFLQARLDGIAEAYGLSHTGDLDVLTDLDRAGPPHQRTPSELADSLLLTTGGMTVRLNRLQRKGLIERLPNPRDGRGVLVRLTPIGKELADDALATLLDTQAASLGMLDPSDQAALADLLRTLLKGLGDTPAFRPAVAVRAHKCSHRPGPTGPQSSMIGEAHKDLTPYGSSMDLTGHGLF